MVLAVLLAAAPAAASAAPEVERGRPPHGGHHQDRCDGRNDRPSRLLDCLTARDAMRHLWAFQAIADANGGTRASGTPGYDASVAYVVERLRRAGYHPTVQTFDFFFYDEQSEVSLDGELLPPFDLGTGEGAYDVMEYSGGGQVTSSTVVGATGNIVPMDPDAPPSTSSAGCAPEDYPTAPEVPAIALVQRGTCDFAVKALNAQQAGYDAVLIFNEGQPGRDGVLLGTLGEASLGTVTIPVLGISYASGVELLAADTPAFEIDVTVQADQRQTSNVIAERRGRHGDDVVMLGAHLDSVPEGPGINDNGSGSAAILEIALKLARSKLNNPVRFAWWGAEESGLVGSQHYVDSLDPAEVERLAVYLNFDMVASPNFVRFIYDGDQSTFEAPVPVPPGSAEVEHVFQRYFDHEGLAYEDTEFSGRSDYQAFIFAGVPSGGLFTGAEGVKTPEQAATFGGLAGVAYDPCYHQACDDLRPPNEDPDLQAAYGRGLLANVNLAALGQNLDAAGYATLTFARDADLGGSAEAGVAADEQRTGQQPSRRGHGPERATS